MEAPHAMFVHITVDGSGKVVKVDADNGPVRDWGQAAAGWVSATRAGNDGYSKEVTAQTAPINMGAYNTIKPSQKCFTYMDVGRWGGPSLNFPGSQRNFGIVCGRRTALCEYVPNTSLNKQDNLMIDEEKRRIDHPINDLIESLYSDHSSVNLMSHDYATTDPSLVEPERETVYVFLPDLHLPVSAREAPHTKDRLGIPTYNVSDGNHMGRWEYRKADLLVDRAVVTDDEGMVAGVFGKRMCMNARSWFSKYRNADIFGDPGDSRFTAARDLDRFLDLIAASSLKQRIHLVQLGDMYDFWIGLKNFCGQNDNTPPLVVLGDRDGILAGTFIDFWTNATHKLLGPLIDKLHTLPVRTLTFLWGNHDNYLARHTPVRPPGSVPVPGRRQEFREHGIYFEHGQRGDKENRDGQISGHEFTQYVFDDRTGFLRSADPQRRYLFISVAAISFAVKTDFAIYVMGHTHEPWLASIYPKVFPA